MDNLLAGSKIIHKGLPKDDLQVLKPDIIKAKNGLGWDPAVSRIEKGQKNLDYFRKEV